MKDHLLKGLQKLSAQLDIEFSYTVAKHNFELGLPLENSLKSFFKPYFPTRYSFGAGYLIDKDSTVSNQCDWIIYDSFYYSPLIGKANISDGVEFFPYDCAYAVVEVKRTIDTDVLEKAILQIQRIKCLKRNTSSPARLHPLLDIGTMLTKDCSSIETNHIITGIYGYNQKDISSYIDIIAILKKYPYDTLPDFIAIHGNYFIVKVQNFEAPNITDGFRISQLPQQYNSYAVIDSEKMTSSIFYSYMIDRLNNTFLNASDYMHTMNQIVKENILKDGILFPGKAKTKYDKNIQ